MADPLVLLPASYRLTRAEVFWPQIADCRENGPSPVVSITKSGERHRRRKQGEDAGSAGSIKPLPNVLRWQGWLAGGRALGRSCARFRPF